MKKVPKGFFMEEMFDMKNPEKSLKILYGEKDIDAYNHPILIKNREKLPLLAFQIVNCERTYEINNKHLETLIFDVEKERFLNVANNARKEKYHLQEKVNEKISPYFWSIERDLDGDIVCVLCKKTNRGDE